MFLAEWSLVFACFSNKLPAFVFEYEMKYTLLCKTRTGKSHPAPLKRKKG